MAKLVTFHVQLAIATIGDGQDAELTGADLRDAEKNIKAALEFWRSEEGFFEAESPFYTEEIYQVSSGVFTNAGTGTGNSHR